MQRDQAGREIEREPAGGGRPDAGPDGPGERGDPGGQDQGVQRDAPVAGPAATPAQEDQQGHDQEDAGGGGHHGPGDVEGR